MKNELLENELLNNEQSSSSPELRGSCREITALIVDNKEITDKLSCTWSTLSNGTDHTFIYSAPRTRASTQKPAKFFQLIGKLAEQILALLAPTYYSN